MELNKKTRNQLRMQGIGFVILVLIIAGLLFQVSREYNTDFDWTASSRHSLNPASQKVLEKLDTDIKITSYATSSDLSESRDAVRDMIKRYQKYSDRISLEFVDPRLNPQKVRELGIRIDGEMIVEANGRSEHIQDLSETSITNVIQRLIRSTNRHIMFLTGHGERDPLGQANHDLSIFVDALGNKGFKVQPLNLSSTLQIPSNTSVLVIASPLVDLLDGEMKLIKQYVDNGGNLLWFIEPDKAHLLADLAKHLNVTINKGIIVDLDVGLAGNDPTLVFGMMNDHPVTENIRTLQTLYPQVASIDITTKDGWTVSPLIASNTRSWLETGKIEGTIKYDEATDKPGPIDFAFAMTRKPEATDKTDNKVKEQRLIIMGDGDFLSNTYLGTQGNQSLGESMINWLSHDDNFIDIPPAVAPDNKINATPTQMIILGGIFILVLPAVLIGSGLLIWLRRRKK